ncbi:hypothetical protein [Vitiosangium sp. GDMCC 1.1324]|uniref:hypothetical protein n=1 Tax=Vitiosangium sp. (strain GDMCC 1.1324) TaxID=2138576 RepID=UPI000D3683ED|nr:hypothetical protein [Vitiosangium sp. GDMCC 1.1324]PTL76750.1 hypothetical protein DAT35_48350 [Vitiosangium sp. GDMCC 1.1324]
MQNTLEVRLFADDARQFLPPNIGVERGLARRVLLKLDDPLVDQIRQYEQEKRRHESIAVTYWEIHRKYTPEELKQAELFWLRVRPFFEPTGEDCGTEYDETKACPQCGFGAKQVGPLHLDLKRIPKRDIARTLGGEIVVSARLADKLSTAGLCGYELGPVVSRNGTPTPDWYQILLPEGSLELAPQTQVGHSFFAPEPDSARCPNGHVIGFTVLSEVFIQRSSLSTADWFCTRQFLGERFGPYRPEPLLLISQRLHQLLVSHKVKRFDVEVAHLV